jgi:hypothetical protein
MTGTLGEDQYTFSIISHSATTAITTTGHKKEDQLDDLRNVGENSCNPGDGTNQRVQSLMFMMMISLNSSLNEKHFVKNL